jgi:hypothetical protein
MARQCLEIESQNIPDIYINGITGYQSGICIKLFSNMKVYCFDTNTSEEPAASIFMVNLVQKTGGACEASQKSVTDFIHRNSCSLVE